MSVKELLLERGLKRALIVDDAVDSVPTAADIKDAGEVWPVFNDDLTEVQRAKIAAAFPQGDGLNFQALITNDEYVAKIWELRNELGAVATAVFATYSANQASDEEYVAVAQARLEALGLECKKAGRNFHEDALAADIILIDLFLGHNQDQTSLDASKAALKAVANERKNNVPLVILMSSSNRLEDKRDEFRNDSDLLDSAFRVIHKPDLKRDGVLELQLQRLAQNATHTRLLADFVHAIEDGHDGAVKRTLALLRKLKLSDIGQIQELLLSAEGEPTGSYLVDVFDRVLQHEIERDEKVMSAAKAMNGITSVEYPPAYVSGSPDLQELVERTLTHNSMRLSLQGSLDSPVTFGDVLRLRAGANADTPKIFDEMGPKHVLLVVTPVCDLQRGDAPRVLMLVGEVEDVAASSWSYKGEARTVAINLDGELRCIKWHLKHVVTASGQGISDLIGSGDLLVAARLRESHALELQQKLLSGLGRVGQIAALPATFSVDLDVYYSGLDGKPLPVQIDGLAEGAVCWVGRNGDGTPAIRLMITEMMGDRIQSAFANLDPASIAVHAQGAFNHLVKSQDLLNSLAAGLELRNQDRWLPVASLTGAPQVPTIGLIGWNKKNIDAPLDKTHQLKAGIILAVKDKPANGSPKIGEAISALIMSEEIIAKPAQANVEAPVEGEQAK